MSSNRGRASSPRPMRTRQLARSTATAAASSPMATASLKAASASMTWLVWRSATARLNRAVADAGDPATTRRRAATDAAPAPASISAFASSVRLRADSRSSARPPLRTAAARSASPCANSACPAANAITPSPGNAAIAASTIDPASPRGARLANVSSPRCVDRKPGCSARETSKCRRAASGSRSANARAKPAFASAFPPAASARR